MSLTRNKIRDAVSGTCPLRVSELSTKNK